MFKSMFKSLMNGALELHSQFKVQITALFAPFFLVFWLYSLFQDDDMQG